MDDTTARMIASGVVGHLCLHHWRLGEKDNDWSHTTSYAMRSFPDAPTDVVKELVGKCREAVSQAAQHYGQERLTKCGELVATFLSNASGSD